MKTLPFLFKKYLIIGLIIIVGFLILWPTYRFENFIAPGDHGRDFYAFEQVLNGEVIYQDFWWCYGPLMPYYYALCYKIFGISIQSVLLGEIFLKILAAVLFFLCLSCFCTSLFSLAASLWFLAFNTWFFHAYNHAGGIVALLFIALTLFRYIQSLEKKYVYWALSGSFVLCLIKLNFGILAIFATLFCLLMIDFIEKRSCQNKKLYLLCAIALPFLVVLAHLPFLHKLSLLEIRQCFPILSTDHPFNVPFSEALLRLKEYLTFNLSTGWINIATAILCLSCIINFFLVKKENKKKILLALGCVAVFAVFSLHEFLKSGVIYRLFWAKPFQILFVLLIIGASAKALSRTTRSFLIVFLSTIIFLHIFQQHQIIKTAWRDDFHLQINQTDIYIGNPPPFAKTVSKTTHFLKNELKENETFFALPYDALYYFLAEKKSPTRQLIFFDHILVSKEQEQEVIQALEEKDVNYVLLSNRMKSTEHGLGTFGETYCPLLADYIYGNFEEVKVFGDWQNEPGWAWNHGTKILKRK